MKKKAEKLINVPTALFIDTSYYVSQGLKFTTADFDKLKKHFKPKSLWLILPIVARRELERKFGERADVAAQVIHKADREYPINLLKDWPYSAKGKTELRANLLAVMEHEWQQFQRHFKVIPLTDNGNMEEVLDWYFQKKPPFGEGKKEKEFPDAIIISSLDKYCAKHKVQLAVISLDGDFGKASPSHPRFTYFESLAAYLEKSIAEQATIQRIHKLLEERAAEFRSVIEHHFEKLDFTVGQGWEGCVSDIQDTSVEIQEQSIIDLEEIKFTVAAVGFISFKAYVEYAEYSSAARQFDRHPEHYNASNRVRFRATVEIKTDSEFTELKDYSITYFSPESVFVDYGQ